MRLDQESGFPTTHSDSEPGVVVDGTAPIGKWISFSVGSPGPSMFVQLADLAESNGRMDLAEEFRKRDREANASPPGPSPEQAAAAKLLAQAGLIALKKRDLSRARSKLDEAIALDADCHDAHANLGVLFGQSGKRAEAEKHFREAIRIRPEHQANYGNLCSACLELGKLPEAEDAIRKAVELAPKEGSYHRQLGMVLDRRGQTADAEIAFRAALALKPNDVDSNHRLGRLLSKLNRPGEAETCFRKATELEPDVANHWNGLGGSLEAQNNTRMAIRAYRVAVKLDEKNAESHNNLGVALAAQRCWAEAEASYRTALSLAPRSCMVFNNLGNNLRSQERLDEAVECLKEAIRISPNYSEAHNNLGIVMAQLRRIDESIACYDEALRLKPDYPEAHLNRSLQKLAAGDFENGLPEYEARFKMRHRSRPTAPAPEWDGSPLDGRRLLLRAEQGIGDVAQFMRFGRLIPRGSGGTVILECPEPLIDLAKTCAGIDEICVRGKELPPCDIFTPLLSAAGLVKLTLATIPAQIPYVSTDPARVEFWRNELARSGIRQNSAPCSGIRQNSDSPTGNGILANSATRNGILANSATGGGIRDDSAAGLRIGVSWQGSTDHRGDHLRSVPLSRFAALAKIPGVTLYSLQKGAGSDQLLDGSAQHIPILDYGSRTSASFADTAALIQSLDLVVSVDTAIVHVAGALGAPVWVMIPAASDWRWFIDREDSPWYPTMRLFRQPKPGDWDTVFARIASALEQWPERLRRTHALAANGCA